MQKYGSTREIARQNPENIAKTAGVSLDMARKILEWLGQ